MSLFEVFLTTANVPAAANVYTKIPFNSKVADPDVGFDNTTNFDFTVPVGEDGYYQVNLIGGLVGVPDGGAVAACIFKNGAAWRQDYSRVGAAGEAIAAISISMKLAAGDVIDGRVFNGTGGALDITNSGVNTHFSAFKIA